MSTAPVTPRRLRMILNTFISGPQAWFFVADERGYLAEEGLKIDFTPGDTAANAVPRVADGEFDIGYGDFNALIELAGRAGPVDALAVYATFTASPYTIAVPADGPVEGPADLASRRLGAHPNDAAMRMWPEFAAATGLAADGIDIDICADPHKTMVPDMLERGRWDGLFGFVNTLRAAALEAGIDPHRRLRFIEYRESVPDLYGATLLVSRRLAASEPAIVRGLVRAVNRAMADTLADPDAAMDAVVRRDPPIDRAANLARLTGTLALEMAGAEQGIGWVDTDRLARAAALIARAKGLPRVPASAELFDASFLPAPAERIRTAPLA